MQYVRRIGVQNNDSEFKANMSTTNVKSTKISRQNDGAMIINMAFANAPEMEMLEAA